MSVDTDVDYAQLDRELDRVKADLFIGKNAAFLGPLLCSMDFHWSERCQTAETDGANIWWNLHWFQTLPPKTRLTVLLHELWHTGGLHFLRKGERDHKIWCWACDIEINNNLHREGYSFEGTKPLMDLRFPEGTSVEEIYEDLFKQGQKQPQGTWGGPPDPGDMIIEGKDQLQQQLNAVVQAVHSAQINGSPGDVPGHVKTILKKFLEPKVPWESALAEFFRQFGGSIDYRLMPPNRRHRHRGIVLPSHVKSKNKLDHLIYFLDVSGSVSDADVVRFNSEVKFIKEQYKPDKLTLVQFDTVIQDVKIFEKDDPFDEIVVVGRGGTCLREVREMILKEHPTAAIIFSDLFVTPMEPVDIPIIWVAVGNKEAQVTCGKIIHIRNE